MLIDVFHKPRNTGLTSPSPGFLGEGWTGEPYVNETGPLFDDDYPLFPTAKTLEAALHPIDTKQEEPKVPWYRLKLGRLFRF